MKVLITGGMGVIGSMVSQRFVREGHRMGGPTHYYSIYDITRARLDLGFFPEFTLGGGIEDYIETLNRPGS